MYSPLIFKDKGLVVNTEVLATLDPLNHQLNWLGGIDMAKQCKTASCPVSAKAGPTMMGVSGPTATAKETTGSHGTACI